MTSSASTTVPALSAFWTGNTARARWFDAVSLLLPAGEAFVIETVRDAAATWPVDDPLHAGAQSLIDDEHAHQRAHDRYNGRLAAAGLPVQALQEGIDRLLQPLRAWPLHERVLLAAALEQCTALLSREVLRSRAWLADQDCATAKMWRWHCREEIAHHGIAMDVAARTPHRAIMWPVTFLAAAAWIASDIHRLQRDLRAADRRSGRITRWRAWCDRAAFATVITPSVIRLLLRGLVSLAVPPTYRRSPA